MRRTLLAWGLTLILPVAAHAQSWSWQPGRAYLHPDGTGVLITRVVPSLPTGRLVALGEVVQTPPQSTVWTGSPVVVELEGPTDQFAPAHLCMTQPRIYCSTDRCWSESDRYVQLNPCPVVPIP